MFAAPEGEDFHPKSTIGRFLNGGGGPVADAASSPTLDAGDPTESYASEPSPNGYRANQGSYGNTAEASESNSSYAGCSVVKFVKSTGGYDATTIQGGVNLLPTSLTGHSCVIIEDSATYAEQVTVANFTMNGSSISIKPDVGFTPIVSPPVNSTAAFYVTNSSVNIFGINIVPT